ncbi:adenosine receptor A1-like [Polypterus senegalus]|uniref:adenosine receptor A1-like n=1 Tax=Polypterus senegalus TaxID=55291 RepID=UPI001964423A|nr:adenosine receptor A1-like [Polypterus senegalus]
MLPATTQSNFSSGTLMPIGTIIKVCGMVVLSIFITVGNVLILLVFLGSKRFWTPQGYLKVSLALADLAVGAVVVPYSVYTEIGIIILGRDHKELNGTQEGVFEPCYIMGPLFAGCTFVSITTIFLLSIEMSITVLRPLHKHLLVTKKRTVFLIACSWVLCFFLALMPLFFRQEINIVYNRCSMMCNYASCSSSSWKVMLIFPTFDFSVLGGTFAINLITFTAIRQFCQARKHLTHSASQKQLCRPSFSDIKAAKTIAIVVLSFVASFVPIAVYVVISILGLECCQFTFFAFWILTSNSCWNVVIYSLRDKKFRHRIKELCTRTVLRRSGCTSGPKVASVGTCVSVLKETLHTESS